MPKENAPCHFLSIIMLGSVITAMKKYYPQTLLEEWKYEPNNIKMENIIDDDDLEESSSDESGSESDNDETESDNGKDNDESNE